jgi:hypothetical protein
MKRLTILRLKWFFLRAYIFLLRPLLFTPLFKISWFFEHVFHMSVLTGESCFDIEVEKAGGINAHFKQMVEQGKK